MTSAIGLLTTLDGSVRHRAFLSYSHRDEEACIRLHADLENYEVPKELVGKKGAHGPIPAHLRPIFRDRSDLEAGDTVRAQVCKHLEASDAMIVICSPDAAGSYHVNEEIRYFKSLGRTRRIYPFIVAGRPGNRNEDCFPPALRFEVASDGTLTDKPEHAPLAGDAREDGDGFGIAELKIIAGLLGVSLDTLRQRERVKQQRLQRRRFALVAAMLALTLGTAFSGLLYKLNQQLTLVLDRAIDTASGFANRTASLAESVEIRESVATSLLEQSEQALNGLKRVGASGFKLDHALAMTSLTVGKHYGSTGQRDQWWTRANDALRIMREQLANKSSDPIAVRGLVKALLAVSTTYRDINDLDVAQTLIDEAVAKIETHAKADDADVQFKLELADVYAFQAELQQKKDQSADAIRNWKRALEIRREVLARHPDNVDAELQVSIAHSGLSQTLSSDSKTPEAIEQIGTARAIRERLVAAHPRDVRLRRYLAWALHLEAEAVQPSDSAKAKGNYERVHTIRRQLLDEKPTMEILQRDMGWYHWAMSEHFPEPAMREKGVEHAREAVRIFRGMLGRDPENRQTQRDVGRAEARLGRTLVRLGRLDEAFEPLQAARDLLEPAVEREPENRRWRLDLAMALVDLGFCHARNASLRQAEAHYHLAGQHLEFLSIAGSESKEAERLRSRVDRLLRDLQGDHEKAYAGPAPRRTSTD